MSTPHTVKLRARELEAPYNSSPIWVSGRNSTNSQVINKDNEIPAPRKVARTWQNSSCSPDTVRAKHQHTSMTRSGTQWIHINSQENRIGSHSNIRRRIQKDTACYRPVALLLKIMKGSFGEKIREYMNKNKIHEIQHGFRKSRSYASHAIAGQTARTKRHWFMQYSSTSKSLWCSTSCTSHIEGSNDGFHWPTFIPAQQLPKEWDVLYEDGVHADQSLSTSGVSRWTILGSLLFMILTKTCKIKLAWRHWSTKVTQRSGGRKWITWASEGPYNDRGMDIR